MVRAAGAWLPRTILSGILLSYTGCATGPRPAPVTEVKPIFSTEPPPEKPYQIFPGDEMRIAVLKRGDLSTLVDLNPVTVLPDGKIVLPLVGEIKASGLTPSQLQDLIMSRLEESLVEGAAYEIGTYDELMITVQRQSDLSTVIDLKAVVVLPDGKILVPLAGEMTVAGLTPVQLRDQITARLEEFFVRPVVNVVTRPFKSKISPVVTVTLRTPTKPKVYVLGEVKTPGVYRIDRDTTALEAVALAGGLTRDADTSQVVLLRTSPTNGPAPMAAVSFDELFRKADIRQNVVLLPGDILLVPPDFIARANRVLQFVSNLVAPAAQIFGVVSQVVILQRVGVGN